MDICVQNNPTGCTVSGYTKGLEGLDERTRVLFESVSNELELRRPTIDEASDIIESRLELDQVAAFKWWEQTGRDEYNNGLEKLIDLIKATNFLKKERRNELSSALQKARSTLDTKTLTGLMIPMGNLGGYRYAFQPEMHICKLERAREDEEHYPPVPAQLMSDNLQLHGPYVWLWERTYEEIWCPPPLFGESQGRYGRRSGGDVIGGPPTGGHWGENGTPPGMARRSEHASRLSLRGLSRRSTAKPSCKGRSSFVSFGGLAGSSVDAAPVTPPAVAASAMPDNRHAFMVLGRLHVKPPSMTVASALKWFKRNSWGSTDYVVAVSMLDSSVWVVYGAWGKNLWYDETQTQTPSQYEPRKSWPVKMSSKGRFQPERDRSWGRLKGCDERRLLTAKIADDVKSWVELGSFDSPIIPRRGSMKDGSVPVFVEVYANVLKDEIIFPYW